MRNVLHYFHVHDDKGSHADGETYSIVLACDDHLPIVEAREGAEYVATSDADEERCDVCPKHCGHIVDNYTNETCGALLPCMRHK
jgi:hypothetical protein